MGRISGGYGHSISKVAHDHYRLSWTVDRKYEGSRLRFPTSYRRDTDAIGALRFARKWDCEMPEEREPGSPVVSVGE